ncbi:hypothetical protein LMH73_002650 [Vibrio splendidus]|nr:hypothetical protein [Vibrio splendidus]MCC4880471.1 hypothetical protein [Vibrio splendidus]
MKNNTRLLSNIFEQFNDLFGIDFASYFSGDSNAIQYDLQPFAQCREVSEHLFYLGLKSLYESRVKNVSYSLMSLLSDSSSVSQSLVKHRNLIALLEELTDIEDIKAHQELIQFTVSQLSGREITDSESVSIKNASWYTFASFAKFTMSGLHSYVVGNISSKAILPMKYAKSIYVIDDERHILGMARSAKPGIYLVSLMNDDEVAASCFYMIMKTTEGAVVLTDSDIKPYVGQRSRTDRKNLQRMDKSLFPYSVFNIEVLNAGRYTRFNKPESTSLVTHSESFTQKAIKDIIDISSIQLGEMTNLAVLFTMIGSDWHKYINSNQLITGSELLLASPEASNDLHLPVEFNGAAPLSIPVIVSKDDFYDSTSQCDEYANKRTSISGTDRNDYFSKVFADSLNSVRIITDSLLLENKTESEVKDLVIVPQHGIATPQMLVADTIQLARAKQAANLQDAVNTYFDEHIDDMLRWVLENADVNKLAILAAQHKALPEPSNAPEWLSTNKFGHSIVRFGIETNYRNRFEYYQNNNELSKAYRVILGEPKAKDDRRFASCVITGAYANYFVKYSVSDSLDLQFITNTELDDMPYHLKELGMGRYVGNNILDRIDPVEAVNHSFYRPDGNKFLFVVGLSLAGLNKVRLEQGLHKLSKGEADMMFKAKYPNFW